jgi:hypothetical protein
MTPEQTSTLATELAALRRAEIALDDGVRRSVGHLAVRELRAACVAHETAIDDVLADLGLPRGTRWGCGPDCD